MRAWVAALAAGAVLVAGCSTFAPITNPEREYAGRFAVTTTLADKRDSSSGRFRLAVERATTVLDLDTPLGSTLARVVVDPRGAHLMAPGSAQREVHGPSAQALTYEVLGWPVPVDGFRAWIDGRPAGDRPATTIESGEGFRQEGWTVSVLERFDSGRGAPRRLLFERPEEGGQVPAISLRLVLDEPAKVR